MSICVYWIDVLNIEYKNCILLSYKTLYTAIRLYKKTVRDPCIKVKYSDYYVTCILLCIFNIIAH